MKNICKTTVNGKLKFLVSLTISKGKRQKRYFNTEKEAKEYLKNYQSGKSQGFSDFTDLTPFQIMDIKNAMAMLPSGKSLSDCVKLALNLSPQSKTLKDTIFEFVSLKESKLTAPYLAIVRGRLRKFLEAVPTYEKATPEATMQFCKEISDSPKTQLHYIRILQEFFAFAARKGYFTLNPFDKIHASELPKIKRKSYEIPTVETLSSFFKELENSKPRLAGLYALVAFGGFRIAEAQRITPENINFDTKEIILPFYNSKTGETWLQANMPENVWDWLKKYPPTKFWQYKHPEREIKELKDSFNLENNALRHSFATYHLSLYRDAPKTQILMRHRSSTQLWQTYLAGLKSKETAAEYFNIRPTSR